jgi:hypothetical protein
VFHSLEFGESDGTVVSVGINPPEGRNSMRHGSPTFFGTFGVEVEFVIVTIDSGIHSYFPFVVEIFQIWIDLDQIPIFNFQRPFRIPRDSLREFLSFS